jgi:hypothetical protein
MGLYISFGEWEVMQMAVFSALRDHLPIEHGGKCGQCCTIKAALANLWRGIIFANPSRHVRQCSFLFR